MSDEQLSNFVSELCLCVSVINKSNPTMGGIEPEDQSPGASTSTAPTPVSETGPEPKTVEKVDDTKQADELKEQGNVAFKAANYDKAIEYYTRAISMLYHRVYLFIHNFVANNLNSRSST